MTLLHTVEYQELADDFILMCWMKFVHFVLGTLHRPEEKNEKQNQNLTLPPMQLMRSDRKEYLGTML